MRIKKSQRNIIRKGISTIVCMAFLCIGIGFSQENSYGNKLNGLIGPIDTIIGGEKPDKLGFIEAVSAFCESMTEGDPMHYNNFVYNAKNSIFMYRLCNDTNEKIKIERGPGLSSEEDKSYVQFVKTSDNKKIDRLKNMLPPSFDKTAQYVQEVFDTLIESYMTIYQGTIYGEKGDDKKTIEELVDEFSKQYFRREDKAVKYLSICDKEHKYPQTCNKMVGYVKEGRNKVRSSSNILNTKLLYDDVMKAVCNPKNNKYNTISCGLYGGDITKFVNLVYNELFFYTSFIQYYVYILDTQPEFKAVKKDTLMAFKEREGEIALIQKNLSDSRRATKLSIRLVKEAEMTFPIHIGFLLYTEGINSFVQKFNQTLIPIYTFGDIFRNVQDTR